MSLTTSELSKFSDFCKKNNYHIPVSSTETFLKYEIKKNLNSREESLKYLYYLLPKDKESQQTLKSLIYKYFNYMINDSSTTTFHIINEYLEDNHQLLEILEDINSGNISKIKKKSSELIMNDIEADFTRPVSDLYWLNQIKKTRKYKDFFDIFNNLDISKFSELTNQLNKNNLEKLLDNLIRKLLLDQTYQLGKKLAIKYKRFIKDSNKGRLYFRKTIRKSLESGGSLQKIIFKPKLRQKPKLTIVCDISGSMALNSLFGVTLLYGMVSKFTSIKAYVFIDGITEISKTLRSIKKNEIETIFSRWSEFVKSDGHSDYQTSFKELIELDSSENGTLIVIGDARNNYRNISEDLIEDLDEKYKKIFWINPEQRKYWNTGDSQMLKFEAINYKTAEVRNYKQLKDFIKEMDFKKVLSL